MFTQHEVKMQKKLFERIIPSKLNQLNINWVHEPFLKLLIF